jgi:zinc-ribbon domain
VEHACAHCGVPVEDGVPFCKNCGAPQIRVAAAEPVLAAPMYSSPHPPTVAAGLPYTVNAPKERSDRLDWSAALPAIALAGLTVAVSLLFPFGILGGGIIAAGTIASGYISVGMYHRKRPQAEITRAIGASLGALSGSLGFLLSTILFVAGVALTGSWNQVRDLVAQQLNATLARNPDPKVHELANQIRAGDGFVTIIIAGLLITGLVIVIVSTLAGWMAARSLERKNRLGM